MFMVLFEIWSSWVKSSDKRQNITGYISQFCFVSRASVRELLRTKFFLRELLMVTSLKKSRNSSFHNLKVYLTKPVLSKYKASPSIKVLLLLFS